MPSSTIISTASSASGCSGFGGGEIGVTTVRYFCAGA
jgi:hypothetical protein